MKPSLLFIGLLGPLTAGLLSAHEPRSYASLAANPTGPPDEVASMIMRKPIYPLAVHAVAFSPDGRTLAAGDGTGRVRLWDPATGGLLREWPAHTNWVFSLVWTDGGTGLLTGGGDNLIREFDVRDPARARRTLPAHTNDVHAIALTRDGRRMFSAGDDRQIVVWNLETGAPLRRLTGHERQIPALRLSPDERLIASGGRDHTVRLWDADSGAPRDTLIGHTGDVVALDFSPDGARLASAGWDYTVRLWDVRTGKALRVWTGNPNWVSGVAFAPDGRRLAASSGGRLRLLDAAGGGEVWATAFQGVIRNADGSATAEDLSTVVFSPDGRLIAVGSTNGSVYLVSAETGEIIRQLTPPAGTVGE